MRTTHDLPTRLFGTTGRRITRVGFGAGAIGGGGWSFVWGGQDDAESVAAIQHAVASGIQFTRACAETWRGRA